MDLYDQYSNETSYPWNTSSLFAPTNSSNTTDLQLRNQFILPWWRQMIWTLLFVGMITVATGGNLIVIWIVLANKRMRTVTNYFLVNLSIADAMVSTLNVTFNYTYMLNSHWPFGTLYCKISQFIAVLTICASVFTLMAISIDRYMAIVYPLRKRMGKRATLCVAIVIWIVGAILSLPMLLLYTTYTQNFVNGEVRVICYSDWPNKDEYGLSYDEYLYNVIFMILTYFLPIGSMTFTYARVGLELWGSQSIGENIARQLESIRSKRRVVKMMIVVVVIFAVCWLPFHVYFIVTSYLPEITNEPYIQEVFLGIYWLAMSNSMYNPIIYCWMNSRFRRGFAQFFFWCPGVQVPTEPSLSRSEAVTSRYSCTGSPEAHARISRNGTSSASTSSTTPTHPGSCIDLKDLDQGPKFGQAEARCVYRCTCSRPEVKRTGFLCSSVDAAGSGGASRRGVTCPDRSRRKTSASTASTLGSEIHGSSFLQT